MADSVCPWWIGYLLANPLRALVQNPEKIVAPWVAPGMIVMDLGCAMGFFSLALAGSVGPDGRVLALDVQRKMLDGLMRRAGRAGLADRIEARLCRDDGLGLDEYQERVDFALAFAMVHEVPNPSALMAQVARALKPRGRLLVSEPRAHVSADDFKKTVETAVRAGLKVLERPSIRLSRSVVLEKGKPVSDH